MNKLGLLLPLVVMPCWSAHSVSTTDVRADGSTVTLRNRYIEVRYDRARHAITALAADFSGGRRYGGNLLAPGGIVLEAGGAPVGGLASYRVAERGARLRVIFETAPQSRWTLVLRPGEHGFRLETETTLRADAAAQLHFYLRQWFLNGIYERGVVQSVAGSEQRFNSTAALKVFYTMDRTAGSVAIVPDASNNVLEHNLLSGRGEFAAGLEEILAGASAIHDRWSPLSAAEPARRAGAAGVRHASYQIYANDRAFPVHRPTALPNMAGDDLAAYLTAVYGSSIGVVGSYAIPGSAYPTLATPKRPYGETYNYFDPDAWSTVATLSFSGDPLLQKEARQVLERSEHSMTADGQLPHHFNSAGPTYISLAKSSQTGPNIFWVLAAIDYASGSGDDAWLRAHYPSLKHATEWLLVRLDPQRSLLNMKGSLFIDVFIREHYTADTNAMMVHLLDLMSRVATVCSDPVGAHRFAASEQQIRHGINTGLWDGHDHYVTQRNADWTVRDRVDYDANYAALAFGLPGGHEQEQAILARLDQGAHTHPRGRGTWVSEQRYERPDCFLNNDGDSDVAMARIWWLDMAARYRLGDLKMFQSMYGAIRSDLLTNIWMGERYDAAGAYAHNLYYHEYPEVLSIVLREMRYGIDVKPDAVTIRPFGLDHYDFAMGGLRVRYAARIVRVRVPGTSTRVYRIYGLTRRSRYRLSGGRTVATGAAGIAEFRAPAGATVVLTRMAAETSR